MTPKLPQVFLAIYREAKKYHRCESRWWASHSQGKGGDLMQFVAMKLIPWEWLAIYFSWYNSHGPFPFSPSKKVLKFDAAQRANFWFLRQEYIYHFGPQNIRFLRFKA